MWVSTKGSGQVSKVYVSRVENTCSQVYNIEGEDLCMIGTAEIPLAGMFANKILPVEDLPIKLVGFSHCFRMEAGARGQENKGLYRLVSNLLIIHIEIIFD
jgi:seryl-tRNA synthetase